VGYVGRSPKLPRRGSHERSDLSDAAKNEVPAAPSEMTPARCYEVLLANPAAAVQALDKVTAAGLSRIVIDYLTTTSQ